MGGRAARESVRMRGPHILVRSLSHRAKRPDRHGNRWQYHPRSDRHSKIACWVTLFDLMDCCPLFRSHVEARAIGFGINHEMQDFRTAKKKNLDLVISTVGTEKLRGKTPQSFEELVEHYGVDLSNDERRKLDTYPPLRRVPVGTVHLALEAKATMTEHTKALPRLHDELNSSHLTIHGSSDFAIAAGFAMVNLAVTFVSPIRDPRNLSDGPPTVTTHTQPRDTERTIAKIREIPRRANIGETGFDALGIVVVELSNDGTPATLVEGPPAPPPADIFHYDQMIRRIQSLYEGRFANL